MQSRPGRLWRSLIALLRYSGSAALIGNSLEEDALCAARAHVLAVNGRVARIGDRNVLRLGKNPATQLLYRRIDHAPAGSRLE